ncbi:MAG TPA: hypothetical protein VJB70_01485 [Candidatus Paceibacterota bacterium]
MPVYGVKEICLHTRNGIPKIWSTLVVGCVEADSQEKAYEQLGLVPIKIAEDVIYYFIPQAGNSWDSLMKQYLPRVEQAEKKDRGAFFYAYVVTAELVRLRSEHLKLLDKEIEED